MKRGRLEGGQDAGRDNRNGRRELAGRSEVNGERDRGSGNSGEAAYTK